METESLIVLRNTPLNQKNGMSYCTSVKKWEFRDLNLIKQFVYQIVFT